MAAACGEVDTIPQQDAVSIASSGVSGVGRNPQGACMASVLGINQQTATLKEL